MPPTLLVVEDEPDLAALLRLLLEGAAYRVEVAAHGAAALRRLAGGGYALVLSDVMMPYLDGRALARAMHTDPALRAIPLVLLSAVAAPPAAEAPRAAFVAKPFDLEELLAVVERLLGPDRAGR